MLLGGLPSDVDAAIAEVVGLLRRSRKKEDLAGKTVCFTGASTLPARRSISRPGRGAEELAATAGLVPQSSVTKKLDILVPLIRPQSSKASKARANGTRGLPSVNSG